MANRRCEAVQRQSTVMPPELSPHSLLGAREYSLHPLACTSVAEVYAAQAADGQRWIVKFTRDSASVEQERAVHKALSLAAAGMAPGVIGCGHTPGGSWIAYEDWGLTPVRWSDFQWLRAARLLADTHRRLRPFADVFTGQSHTPSVKHIVDEIAGSLSTGLRVLHDGLNLSWSAVRRLQRMCDSLTASEWWHGLNDVVVCHGDPHCGNVLWSRSNRRMYFIDWSYAHVDSAYFDLFQLLDATSPTTPAPRRGSRLEALRAYLRARGQPMVAEQHWLRAYLRYASVHLLWILTRIAMDLSTSRFDQHALSRQVRETLRGLGSLERDWHRVRRRCRSASFALPSITPRIRL